MRSDSNQLQYGADIPKRVLITARKGGVNSKHSNNSLLCSAKQLIMTVRDSRASETQALVSAMLQKKKRRRRRRRQFLAVSSECFRKRMFPKSKMLYTRYFYLRLNSCCDVNYSPRLRPPQILDLPSNHSGHFISCLSQEVAPGTTTVSGQMPFIIRNLFLPAS